jgi:hypothetical protein
MMDDQADDEELEELARDLRVTFDFKVRWHQSNVDNQDQDEEPEAEDLRNTLATKLPSDKPKPPTL